MIILHRGWRRIRKNMSGETTRSALAMLLAVLLFIAIAPNAKAQGCVPLPPYATEADRIGMNVITDYGKGVNDYDASYLGAGWFIDYRASQYGSAQSSSQIAASASAQDSGPSYSVLLPHVYSETIIHNMGYARLLRTTDLDGNWEAFVTSKVSAYPGMLWIIGNEPDRDLQEGKTPNEYLQIYHDVYSLIKQIDPTAQVAIAGVVQPTPLRLRYLDEILDGYKQRYGVKMPVDVWNVHGFILRESNEWGAGIPPGLEAYADEGILFEVSDHGDIKIFKQQLRDFRRWMRDRGYRDTPLIVTEYGILMDPGYLGPGGREYDYAFISEYMLASFDFLRTATSTTEGYPADGNRLVQSWSWFGMNNYVYHSPDREDGFNGNLADHDSGAITPLGDNFAAYTASFATEYTDLAFRKAVISESPIQADVEGETVELDISVYNRGNDRVPNAHIRIWLGEAGSGQLLEAHPVTMSLQQRCRNVFDKRVELELPPVSAGKYQLVLELVGSGASPDPIPQNDTTILTFSAINAPNAQSSALIAIGH